MKKIARWTVIFASCMHLTSKAFSQTAWIDSVKKILVTQTIDSIRINSLIGLCDAYKRYDPDSSLKYGLQSLVLSQKIKSDYLVFWSYVMIADALIVLGNYPLELEYCYKADALADKIKDTYVKGYADGMFSNYYSNTGQFKISLGYYRKVVDYAERYSPNDQSIVRANFSMIFTDMGEADSALFYAIKAYEGVRSNSHLNMVDNHGLFEKSMIAYTLGLAFAGKEKFDSALVYYRQSLALTKFWDTNLMDNYNGIAATYKSLGQLDSAGWYAKKAIGERVGKSYPTGLLKATTMLAGIYEQQHKNDSALKYLKQSIALKDSLFNREKMNTITNLTAGEQDKQNAITSAKTKLQNQFTLYLLIAGFVILLLIAAMLMRNRRQKQLQGIRNSIAADLHDDIGSTLTHISILSELSRKTIHPENEASKFLTRLNEQVYSTGQALDDIIWSVNVRNDSMPEMMVRMRRYCGELLDNAGISYDLDLDPRLTGTKLSMAQRHDCYLVFKEALNNIFKHAGAEKVSVQLYKKEDNLQMRIEDDGRGINELKDQRNGIKNMRARAVKWGGELTIESAAGGGTLLILQLPLKK